MNQVFLCGRLTREPESKSTQSGTSMTRYTLAVDRRGKDAGTDFLNIIAFGKGADFAKNYFHQGMRVLVQGRIQTGSYTNRDGQKVSSFDIIADNQEFADGRQQGEGSRVTKQSRYDEFMNIPEGDEDGIPF